MVEPTLPGDAVPEADLIAQHTLVEDTAEDTSTDSAASLFPTPMAATWDADETDQLEQTITVPLPEEDDHDPTLDPASTAKPRTTTDHSVQATGYLAEVSPPGAPSPQVAVAVMLARCGIGKAPVRAQRTRNHSPG